MAEPARKPAVAPVPEETAESPRPHAVPPAAPADRRTKEQKSGADTVRRSRRRDRMRWGLFALLPLVLLGGGYGSPLGLFFGSAIYGIISVGIFYTGWNTDWLLLILGALLLAAVLANSYFRRLALAKD